MSKYKDGTVAQKGDVVRGTCKGYPYAVQGVVTRLLADGEIDVQHVAPNIPVGSVSVETAVGDTKDFEKVANSDGTLYVKEKEVPKEKEPKEKAPKK
jgi:hypothetical protein